MCVIQAYVYTVHTDFYRTINGDATILNYIEWKKKIPLSIIVIIKVVLILIINNTVYTNQCG